MFEATHGSAPKYKGKNKVNPMAMMFSGMLMLRHLEETEAADRLERALAAVIAGRERHLRHEAVARDPTAVGTRQVAEAVIAKLRRAPCRGSRRRAASTAPTTVSAGREGHRRRGGMTDIGRGRTRAWPSK